MIPALVSKTESWRNEALWIDTSKLLQQEEHEDRIGIVTLYDSVILLDRIVTHVFNFAW